MENIRLRRRQTAERNAQEEIAVWGRSTVIEGPSLRKAGRGGGGGGGATGTGVAAVAKALPDLGGPKAEFVPYAPIADDEWQVMLTHRQGAGSGERRREGGRPEQKLGGSEFNRMRVESVGRC